MKNDSFDTIINQKLSDHHCPVPADAWDNIVKRKKKKRYAMYWWFFSVVLLTSTAIFAWYLQPGVQNDSLVKEKMERKDGIVIRTQQLNTTKINSHTFENKKINDSVGHALRSVMPDAISSISDHSKESGKKLQQNIYSKEKRLNLKEYDYRSEEDAVSVMVSTLKNAEPAEKVKLFSTKPQEEKNNESIKTESEADTITSNKKLNGPVKGRYYELAKLKIFTPADSLFTSKIGLLQLRPPVIATTVMNKEKLRAKHKKLTIDFSVTPGLPLQVNERLLSVQRTTTTNEGKAAYKTDFVHTSLKPSIAYTIAFRKKIKKKVAIGTGLQYWSMKEIIRLSGEEINTAYSVVQRLTYVNAVPVLVDDTISTTTSGIRTIRAMNNYDFLSIPLSIHYTLAENSRWDLFVNGGLYFTIKANYKNSITGDLSSQYVPAVKTDGSQQVKIDIHAGLRLSRTFGKQYKLYVEPEIRYNTGKYVLPGMVNYKSIHRVGIAAGFSYELSY